MDELINKIEETVKMILSYDEKGYETSARELSDMMLLDFPKIIAYYTDPAMSDVADDATYWPGQLQRILDAFSAGDDLATADILYNETRANLIELKDVLEKRGII